MYILLVEDNPADVRLTQELFKCASRAVEIEAVLGGDRALERLRRTDLSRPDAVLLDMRLPRMDGADVLAAIRADAALRDIPVAVLSDSSYDRRLLAERGLEPTGWLSKPVDPEAFFELLSE